MFELPAHVRGLIFDFDGTIADTMPLHYQAWLKALGEFGVEFPEALFYEMAGISTPQIVQILNDRHGHQMPVLETARRKDLLYEQNVHQVLPIGPVMDIVKKYFGKYPLAVATGGSRRVVGSTLSAMGLSHFFSVVVSSEEVENGKPAPDVFLEAARRINVAPQLCCGFEDAELGLTAIRAAGMTAVDIRTFAFSTAKAGTS